MYSIQNPPHPLSKRSSPKLSLRFQLGNWPIFRRRHISSISTVFLFYFAAGIFLLFLLYFFFYFAAGIFLLFLLYFFSYFAEGIFLSISIVFLFLFHRRRISKYFYCISLYKRTGKNINPFFLKPFSTKEAGSLHGIHRNCCHIRSHSHNRTHSHILCQYEHRSEYHTS